MSHIARPAFLGICILNFRLQVSIGKASGGLQVVLFIEGLSVEDLNH